MNPFLKFLNDHHELVLTFAAFAAGTVDAIAGGGGLITVPALFNLFPPQYALGTNKGQAVFGASAALWRYGRAGLIDVKRAIPGFFLGFLGSLGGVWLVLRIDNRILKPMVLALLVGVAVYVALQKNGPQQKSVLVTDSRRFWANALCLGIGFYDGFLGPGTGMFLIVGFVTILGDTLQSASANAKAVNSGSNLAALIVFASHGLILWPYAVPMAAAQFIGGWLGAHLSVRVGSGLVRKVLLVASFGMMAKIGYELIRGR